MCAFVELGLVFPHQAKGTSPKWPILCRVGRRTTTPSINQSVWHGDRGMRSIECPPLWHVL